MDTGRLTIFRIFIDCGGLLALGYKLLIFNSVLLKDGTLQLDARYTILLFISEILEGQALQSDAELHVDAETFVGSSHLFLFIFLADLRRFGEDL